MAELCVLGLLQILHDHSCRHHSAVQVVHTESLQILHGKVFVESLAGGTLGECPVVHLIGDVTCPEYSGKHSSLASLKEYFLGGKVFHELVDALCRSLGKEKFSRTDVQERKSAAGLPEMHCCQEIVLAAVEHILCQSHTGSDQLCDASLHQSLGELGVLQLVADGHTPACSHQFG